VVPFSFCDSAIRFLKPIALFAAYLVRGMLFDWATQTLSRCCFLRCCYLRPLLWQGFFLRGELPKSTSWSRFATSDFQGTTAASMPHAPVQGFIINTLALVKVHLLSIHNLPAVHCRLPTL
jgi:hypothetical protein